MSSASQLNDLLQLRRQAVAIAFRDSAPDGIAAIDDTAPSGCTYWKYAADGRTFYTKSSDHFSCPVGAHTHGIDLPEETAAELQGLIGTMVELQYLDPNEVAGIPRLQGDFGVAVYGPAADATFDADVILVSGTAKQMMLLAEAAQSAGIECQASMVGRPTCAALPAVLQTGRSVSNLGCIGNRVYTEMNDDELYFAFAGNQLDAIVVKLEIITNANRELEAFHLARVS